MDIISKLLGAWSAEFNAWSCLLKIFLSTFLATLAGTERATKLHSAGIKTFICVSLAGTLCALGDSYLTEVRGLGVSLLCPAAIIGLAVTGTNTILFSSKNRLRGLTTSVGLWVTGIISMAIGYGLYFAGIAAFVLFMLVIMFLPAFEKKMKEKSAYLEAHIELKSREALQVFAGTLRQFGLKINDIEINPAYASSGLGVYSVTMKIVNPELRKKSHKEIIDAISAMDVVSFVEEIF